MSYHREVLSPCASVRRWAWVGVLIGLVAAGLGHFTDASDRHADIDVRIRRVEHDVYWCGQRVDSLRMRSRPVYFIAAPTGGATE